MNNFNEYFFESEEAWLEHKKKIISGTEISIITMPNHKYSNRIKLYRQKVGLEEPDPKNDAMQRGQDIEPMIRGVFLRDYGAKNLNDHPYYIVEHEEFPFLGGTPDGIVEIDGEKYILEIKSSAAYIDRDAMPDIWLQQVNFYMGITGIKKSVIAWMTDVREWVQYYEFDFNEEFYEEQVEAGVEFYNKYILQNVQPPAITGDEVEMYINPLPGKVLYLESGEGESDRVLDLVYAAKVAKENAKDEQEKYETYKGMLKAIMGNNEFMVLNEEGYHYKLCNFSKRPQKYTDKKNPKEIDGKVYYTKKIRDSRIFRINFKSPKLC